MATTKINIGGVLGGSRSISSAKTTITNVKSSYNSTRNQIDPKIMNRNNLNKRFANIYTKLGAVETKIGRINATVNSCVNQYNNTEQDVLANGKEIAETLKITGAVVSLLGIMSPAVKQFEEIGRIIKKDTVLDVTIDKAKEKMVDFIDETIDSLKAGATERTVHGGGGRILEDTEVDNNDAVVETVQQKNQYPSLKHNMTNPICQTDKQYDAIFRQPYGYNAGCCATTYAIGLSIVNDKSYNPTDYWYGGATHYDEGGITDYIDGFDVNGIYKSLLDGKPSMCHYGHNLYDGGQHYVLITGIKENADINNLTYKDFVAIDVATGTEQSLAEIEKRYIGFNLWGYHLFK